MASVNERLNNRKFRFKHIILHTEFRVFELLVQIFSVVHCHCQIIPFLSNLGLTFDNSYIIILGNECDCPASDYFLYRILFAGWVEGSFILLHSFVKKTQKTPKREIEQAKRELEDFKERVKEADS